jgi:integrase
MSTPALAPSGQLPYRLDHNAWVRHLRDHLAPDREWRPGEFDPQLWLFTGDPDNSMTTSTRCRVRSCDTVVTSRCLCGSCQRALTASDLDEQAFITTYQPSLDRHRRTGQTCVVSRDGVQCQRRRRSNRTGLCQAHTGIWNRGRDRAGLTLELWCVQGAVPLLARAECSVSGCPADSKLDVRLCGHHVRLWRASQSEAPPGRSESAEHWAARQPPRLGVHQFSLAALAPTLRWELLYALQQRDAQGQRLDPVAVRGLVTAVADLESLATTPYFEVAQRISKARNVRAYAQLLTRIIALKFEEFRGITHTDKDVWDCLALDLEAPRAGRRPNLSSVEFTPITQRWLREATKDWIQTFRPDSGQLRRTVQACTLASRALSVRPGGGQDPRDLGFADMTAVFQALNNATQTEGRLYSGRYRRGLWARFVAVIDLGRSTDLLRDLPATFRRHPSHTILDEDLNEDEIGKAIPETVIAQLDAHLELLGTDSTYGRVWSITDTATLFQTAYQILRDTGRRPGEVVSLAVDCLEIQDGEYALVYDNHKKHRLRRRLPITTDTAATIQRWQRYRAGLELPISAQCWLFPACTESSGSGHLSTNRFARALHRWVAAIPVLHSDLPGPDGTPIPFDRSLIYPYAFRHSYAQRHADAGVSVEILKELMDHTDLTATQGYYTISLKRKRDAITVMSRYLHDRTGAPCPGSGSATGYELRSVAVPFGNCIEPTNVKAGGKQCPIRFQCAGCGFYRPDPSYLPALENHINTLKADRETALAMDTDEFVLRNLTDQVSAFTRVAASMRETMAGLPDAERAEVEAASAVLRKLRAGRDLSGGHPLLPLAVKDRP